MQTTHTKRATEELKERIRLGKENGFEDTIDKNGEVLSFGEINEKTGLPNIISVADPKTEDRIVYNLIDGTKTYSITQSSDGKDYEEDIINNKFVRQSSREKETGKTKEFVPCCDGFYFFEGITDETGRTTDIDTELKYYESDECHMSEKPKSSCISKLEDGTPYKFTHLITMNNA